MEAFDNHILLSYLWHKRGRDPGVAKGMQNNCATYLKTYQTFNTFQDSNDDIFFLSWRLIKLMLAKSHVLYKAIKWSNKRCKYLSV